MPITLKLQNPIPAHEKSGGSLKKKSLIVLEITFFGILAVSWAVATPS